ncbi:MAG: flagellar assembly protein FliW [Thermodesulfobacteriota bacterium]
MKIRTTRFGEMDIDPEATISTPGGLIGFPNEERYVLIRHSPDSPFFWFQAVDNPDLAFVIIDPALFKPDYQVPLPEALISALKADSPEEISVFVIVTIPRQDPQTMTANLLGPLVINTQARLGRQIVLDERQYSHRHPIMAGGREKTDPASPSRK